MAQQVSELKANARARSGTGGARATRREDKVPAVVYGDGRAPETVALNGRELNIVIGRGKFLSTVFDLDIDGQEDPRHPARGAARSGQGLADPRRLPARGRGRPHPRQRASAVHQRSLSPGLKRGGVLNIVRHEIEVTCPADAIPEYFEFNLEGLEIGRSIHISAVKMPEGVRPTILNRDFTVATIAGHKIEEEADTRRRGCGRRGCSSGRRCGRRSGRGRRDAKAAAGKEGAAKAPAGKEAAGAKPAAKPAAKK